jgi:hypothetical protein
VSFAELDHVGGIFVVDIVVRLILADQRARYLVRHWYDILVLALPLLRPLRLLRLIPLFVGAKPSGHDEAPGPSRNLCRRWRMLAGLLRSPGCPRCRAVECRCQHPRFWRCDPVGGHHDVPDEVTSAGRGARLRTREAAARRGGLTVMPSEFFGPTPRQWMPSRLSPC